MQLASIAAPGERLAAVAPRRPLVMPLPSFLHPPDWTEGSGTLTPGSDGEATRRFDAGGGGVFNVWLGGSFRGKAEILIDGEPAGTARQSLNAGGQYDSFGRVTVSPGRHLIALDYTAADLHPGSAGYPLPFGPLVLSPVEPTDPGILTVVPARAQRLCGRPWDWIELLPGSP
jgi:hypothetical protein